MGGRALSTRLEELLRQCESLSQPERKALLSSVESDHPSLAASVLGLLTLSTVLHSTDPESEWIAPDAAEAGVWPAGGDSNGGRRRADSPFLDNGTILGGRYQIVEYLASGGMGRVYRANDLDLDVPLAIKTLRPEVARDSRSLRRFKQEVLLARSVSHRNVCRIFDLGRDEERGLVFLTMEYLPGTTLAQHLRLHGPPEAEQALSWVRQMADALDAAHRSGIVHLDFKSGNVMLVPDAGGSRVVVTDFGLAVAVQQGTPFEDDVERDTRLASEAVEGASDAPGPAPLRRPPIVGTPAYMSPELVRGDSIGPAADLYALGVVLFEMCTGRLPFRHPTPRDVVLAHLTEEPPNPSALASVDKSWETTILRLLSKEPVKRFREVQEVVLALEGRGVADSGAKYALPGASDQRRPRSSVRRSFSSKFSTRVPSGRTRTGRAFPSGPTDSVISTDRSRGALFAR
ncbi:MAG: serine/threonine protein kinase [Candidatus Eisenbacteria bacterium]|uniref:Serine/threonine protein kinase n=1 Tax=Eiseniibacteriota bacterium TaxID=2212470 RepID=A0A956NFQ0_UNCEI|nr:serine/threonine protein kinase [Candidatus Eisenbacteria bacterium]